MRILVNGEAREVAAGLSLTGLLDELGLGGRKVAVAINRDVIPRGRHAEVVLAPEDRVEIVQAVQGG